MLPSVYLNGDYLDKTAATLNVADLAILRGYGVFDYFRYAKGQPRFLDDHLERFQNSARGLGMELPVSAEELTEVVHQLIERNGRGDGGIRFVLTGGYAPDGYTPSTPNLVAMAYPFSYPPPEFYETGFNVVFHEFERQLPRIKTIDYLEGIRIQPLLKKHGADYVLYVDRDGNVRESDRSNYLIVKDGTLITPVDDILLGITRKHILRLARELGVPVEERAIHREEVQLADEAIIASSTKGVLPITRLGGQPVGNGTVGPVTRRLMGGWRY